MKFYKLRRLLMPAITPMPILGFGGGSNSSEPAAEPATPADPAAPAATPAAAIDPLSSEANGIDIFAAMVDTINNAPAGTPEAPLSSSAVLTPEGMQKLAASQDFTSAIPAELMAKISSTEGGADMLAAFKAMATTSYLTALQHSATLSESVSNSQVNSQANQLESRLNNTLFDREALTSVPGVEHPVVNIAAKGIQSQLKASYPKATAAQLAEMTTKYVRELSNAMNPATTSDTNLTADETDWMAWASGEK